MIHKGWLLLHKFYLTFTNSSVRRNYIYFILSDLASRGIQFATVIYLARVLTDTKYGMIVFALSVQTYLLTFVDFGLPAIGTRELARSKNLENQSNIFANILSIRSIIAVGLFFISVVFSILMIESTEARLVMVATCAFVFPQLLNLDWVYQGFDRMLFVGISRLAYQVFTLIVMFLLINNSADVLQVPIIRFIVGILFSLGIILLSFRVGLIKVPSFIPMSSRIAACKRLLWESWSVAAISFLGLVFNTFDIFYLGIQKGTQVVGWYGSATVFFFLTLSIAASMFQVFFPRLSMAYANQDVVEFSRVYRIFWRSMFLMGAVCTLVPAMFGPFFVSFLFGPSYLSGGDVLPIVMIAASVSFANHTFGGALLAVGLQRYSLLATIVGAIVSVVSVILLVPKFSLMGAAFSRVLAEVASASVHAYYLNSFFKRENKKAI